MDEREAIAWLHRRVGFGLAPGELDTAVTLGVDAVVDRLVDPDDNGVGPAPDPWAHIELTTNRQRPVRDEAKAVVAAWIPGLASGPRPTESWLTWFWHGHFSVSIAKVRFASMMVEHLRLLRSAGRGSFASLLRHVSVDPAMLIWLDGRDNTRATPNENYGREVLELYSVGLDGYTEADVAAATSAVSGWKVERSDPAVGRFVAKNHADGAQSLLGRPDVRDLDGVVATIVADPACARFVAARLATAVLGDAADDGLVSDLAATFTRSDLDVSALLRATIEAGLARLDTGTRTVTAPVPWLAAALRATGAEAKPKALLAGLQSAGQVPMTPPNVGGWPDGPAWLATSAVVGRQNLAVLVAQATATDAPARRLATAADDDALADLLARPGGFSPATCAALAAARKAGGPPGIAPLAVALASPDLMVA